MVLISISLHIQCAVHMVVTLCVGFCSYTDVETSLQWGRRMGMVSKELTEKNVAFFRTFSTRPCPTRVETTLKEETLSFFKTTYNFQIIITPLIYIFSLISIPANVLIVDILLCKFHRCSHEPVFDGEHTTLYLTQDSPAFSALKSVVAAKHVLQAFHS